MGLQNLVKDDNSEMIYNLHLYAGKDKVLKAEYEGLQKCSSVVGRLRKHLAEPESLKRFFDNWCTTLLLL